MSLDVTIPGDRNVKKKEAEKVLKYDELTIEIQRLWNVRNNSDTSNNNGNWNRLTIIRTIPEQHTGIARYQGTTENSHIGHCTHTAESADVNVQNKLQLRNHITCSTDCKYRTAATLCTVETWFVSGTLV